MKKILMTTGIAVLALATVVGAQGYAFNTNLTVGSTGADVTALQNALMSMGYDIPAISSGVASTGYFGSQTLAAVKAYQAANGIPNTGFVGPLTRGALNAGGVATAPSACPAGQSKLVYLNVDYGCLPTPLVALLTPGAVTTTPTVPAGTITTPGVEGTLTVTTNNAGLVSTVYEGETMRPVYGINVEADNSDIAIQRIKVNLGTDTKIYNKGYTKMYVTDGTNVLASSDLNSSTVVKEGSTYYITIAGFNYVVPKDAKKQLVLKADVMSSIDSTDRTTLSSISITIPSNGVRGVDGAGIDQYGPSSSALTSRSTTFSAELAESATLTVSLDSATPKKSDVIAASGSSENELDRLTVLSFNAKAEKDDVKITDLIIKVAKTGSGAATASTTAYIYEDGTEVDSASITGVDSYVFSDFDRWVTKDQTKTYLVKVDIRNADATVANFTATASSTGTSFVGENTKGDSITESGSATGYAIGVRNVGPVITLVSKSATSKVSQGPDQNGISTSTLTANFVFHVKAVGGDLMFGTNQSTTSPFFASTTPVTGTKGYRIYRDGTEDTTIGSVSTTTEIVIPSICSTSGYTNSCLLSEGNETDVSVTLSIDSRTALGAALTKGNYSVGIRALNWNGHSSTFMDGELDWMTSPSISFP